MEAENKILAREAIREFGEQFGEKRPKAVAKIVVSDKESCWPTTTFRPGTTGDILEPPTR